MKILPKHPLVFLLIFSSCEKKNADNSSIDLNKTMPTLFNQVISSDSYNPKTVCECNDDGTKLLNQLLSKRKQFKNINDLYKDKNANNFVNMLKENWNTIRYKCLQTFGTAMITPTNCNNPDNIQAIKDKLYKLDIRT